MSTEAAGRAPLRRLTPGELDDDQRAVYDQITSGPRANGPQRFRLVDADGCLEGPFNALLLRPGLGQQLQALGSAIRFGTAMNDRAREIAILTVAGQWNSPFEQYAHEAIGRAVGLTDAEFDALRFGSDDPGVWTHPADRLLVRATRSLAADGDVDDETYAALVDQIGDGGVFELTTLVGYYATLALQLRVFRVGVPDTNE